VRSWPVRASPPRALRKVSRFRSRRCGARRGEPDARGTGDRNLRTGTAESENRCRVESAEYAGWCDVPPSPRSRRKIQIADGDSRTIATPLDWRSSVRSGTRLRERLLRRNRNRNRRGHHPRRKIYHGRHGAAAEGGHMTIDYRSKTKCGCGSPGCIEALAGGYALERDGAIRASMNWQRDSARGRRRRQSARSGNRRARRGVMRIGEPLFSRLGRSSRRAP